MKRYRRIHSIRRVEMKKKTPFSYVSIVINQNFSHFSFIQLPFESFFFISCATLFCMHIPHHVLIKQTCFLPEFFSSPYVRKRANRIRKRRCYTSARTQLPSWFCRSISRKRERTLILASLCPDWNWMTTPGLRHSYGMTFAILLINVGERFWSWQLLWLNMDN